MAGGPSGTAEGISTASLAWTIIMASFAAFGGILFGFVLVFFALSDTLTDLHQV
jgi:hypothetical protein